jgi:ABC-2 type transport system ATP-binding protein
VRLFGHPPGERAAKQRLGYLPETPYFYDQLTGRELLQYFGRLHGLDAATLRSRSASLLERVGIAYAADRRLRTYSKGMLQRIGMAQALIGDPELVVLDEPMTGLDPIGRSEFRAMIIQLKSEGKTVLFSSHILADAEALCDRVVIIHKGKLMQQGTVAELLGSAGARVRVSLTGVAGGTWHAPYLPESSQAGILTFVLDDHGAGDALVKQALAAGGRLLAYEPLHPDLETVFLRKVGAAA